MQKREEENLSRRQWHSPNTAAEEELFPLGNYENKQREYVEQRKRDMHEHIYQSRESPQYYLPQVLNTDLLELKFLR